MGMNFATNGVEVIEDAVAPSFVDALIAALPESVAGQRHLLTRCEAVRALAESREMQDLLSQLGSAGARPVQAVFFDKNPAHNWAVPWHQDLTIAVATRAAVAGFETWSLKDGVPHVQPPVEILERMTTIRLHLDPCGPDNGPLRVIPGSHRHGRLADQAISRLIGAGETTCCVGRGGIVAMRPLLLHASSRATKPAHRRVIHFEFSPDELPAPLRWFESSRRGAPNLSLNIA